MPTKYAEYRVSPEARRDLEDIWLYSLENWGLEQAHRYIDNLVHAFDQLAANPKIGMSCDHIRKGYFRSKMGRHMIYFRVIDDGIAVIRVLHDRMESSRHL